MPTQPEPYVLDPHDAMELELLSTKMDKLKLESQLYISKLEKDYQALLTKRDEVMRRVTVKMEEGGAYQPLELASDGTRASRVRVAAPEDRPPVESEQPTVEAMP